MSVPTNWQRGVIGDRREVRAAEWYGEYQGQTTLTHGVELGVAHAASRDLRQATQTLIDGFVQGNAGMRIAARQEAFAHVGPHAIVTPLEGRSALGGIERVDVHTTLLANGDLFYVVTVVPERELASYGPTFDRVVQSMRLSDR